MLLGCQYSHFSRLLCFVIWCLASLFGDAWCVKAQKKTAHRHHHVWTLQYFPAVEMPQKQAYNRLLKLRDVLFSPITRQTIRCSEADCCWHLSVKCVRMSISCRSNPFLNDSIGAFEASSANGRTPPVWRKKQIAAIWVVREREGIFAAMCKMGPY